MAHRKTERNPLFAGRWFEDDIILLCLRWYFRFKLSYRDLVAILGERGLSISHSTTLRWVVRYADTCEKRWRRFERPVGESWRVDETFIKVRGQLMYLYRAVDGEGNTVEFCLSRTRGMAAAKAIFRKALKHHREPHSITLDGHRPSHSALRRMGMNGDSTSWGRNPVKIRGCQYLTQRRIVVWSASRPRSLSKLFDIAEPERVPKVPAQSAKNQLGLGLSPLADRRSDCLLHDLFRLPAAVGQSCNTTSALDLRGTVERRRSGGRVGDPASPSRGRESVQEIFANEAANEA